MKKSDSKPNIETPEEELKRLRKEITKLKLLKMADKAKIDKMQQEFKKRRADRDNNRRTKEIAFESIPRHRYSLIIVQLCVLMYMRTNCGLRTLVYYLLTCAV